MNHKISTRRCGIPVYWLLPFVLVAFWRPSGSIAGQRQVKPESTQRFDTLATVNGHPITSGDFLTRFEMSVYPGKDDPTTLEETKRDFLYSMIAEKLLSKAAANSDEPYTASEDQIRKEMQDIFMRDALYRKEIVPRAKVTQQEILHGFKISVYKYIVDAFYFSGDKATAWNFYYTLQGKGAPDIYTTAKSLDIRHDTLEIPYGESTAAIENAFFGHKKGFISKPTVTLDGLVVFKVLSRSLNEYFIKGSTEARWERIKQILVSRKQAELGNDYVENLMRNITVRVNYRIFRPLVHDIQALLEKQGKLPGNPNYQLYPYDLVQLRQEFQGQLDKPFLIYPGGHLTLSDVFEKLPTAMFSAEDTVLPAVTFALHSALRFISQNHFLVERARELGLQNSGEVKYNVGMVLAAYRSYRMADDIMDTVRINRSEVDSFFRTHHDEVLKGVKLRLRIIEANSINEAIAAYTKLKDEKNGQASPADTTARWVEAYHLGEIGAVLSELKDGDVYGPVEARGKFYIYHVLAKKMAVNNAAIKNSIQVAKEMLLARMKRRTLEKYIANLAEKENVRIFKNRLLALKVTPFQMLTYRFIGFGGKILAVPELYPRAGWFKYFRSNMKPPQP